MRSIFLIERESCFMEKRALGLDLLSRLPPSGTIAVGSGTTVNAVLDVFGEALDAENYKFIAASSQTSEYLRKNKLLEIPFSLQESIVLCIDGADQVLTSSGHILKGRGGALLREKILWNAAESIYVVMTNDKFVSQFTASLPIEVVPFAEQLFLRNMHHSKFSELLGEFTVRLRKHTSGMPFYTDNHNLIFDIHYSHPMNDPIALHTALKQLTGVVETGIFLGFESLTTIISSDNSRI